MSSTVLLSKGAGQIYILAVMAEAAVVDDDVPPLTVAVFRLFGVCKAGEKSTFFSTLQKSRKACVADCAPFPELRTCLIILWEA